MATVEEWVAQVKTRRIQNNTEPCFDPLPNAELDNKDQADPVKKLKNAVQVRSDDCAVGGCLGGDH